MRNLTLLGFLCQVLRIIWYIQTLHTIFFCIKLKKINIKIILKMDVKNYYDTSRR